MKPINYQQRTAALLKFIGITIGVMSLFSFVLYSQNIIGNKIGSASAKDNTERQNLTTFITETDKLVKSFKTAESQVERSTFSVEIDKYILDSRSKFVVYSDMFEQFESKYKDIMITNEKLKKSMATGDKDCDEKLEEKETEIEDLEKQLTEQKTDGKVANSEIGNVKTGLMQSTVEIDALVANIELEGLCPTIGRGKQRKAEILGDLRRIKQSVNLYLSQL